MRCLLNNKHELRIRVSEANPSPGLRRPVLCLPPASWPRQAIPAAAAGLALLPQSGPVLTAVRWLLRVPPTPGGRSLGGGEANGSGTGRSGMRTLLPVDRPPARPPCWTNCPDTHGGSTRPPGSCPLLGPGLLSVTPQAKTTRPGGHHSLRLQCRRHPWFGPRRGPVARGANATPSAKSTRPPWCSSHSFCRG